MMWSLAALVIGFCIACRQIMSGQLLHDWRRRMIGCLQTLHECLWCFILLANEPTLR